MNSNSLADPGIAVATLSEIQIGPHERTEANRISELLHEDPVRRDSVNDHLVLYELSPATMTNAVEATPIDRLTASNTEDIQSCNAKKSEPNITIHSQSGRPFLTRPTAEFHPIEDADQRKLFRDILLNHSVDLSRSQSQILNRACSAVSSALTAIGQPKSPREIESWFFGWARYKMDSRTCYASLLRSLAVVMGDRTIDIPFALGEFWRIQSDSNHWTPTESFELTHWVQAGLEKLAFGPSPEVAATFLELIRTQQVRIAVQSR